MVKGEPYMSKVGKFQDQSGKDNQRDDDTRYNMFKQLQAARDEFDAWEAEFLKKNPDYNMRDYLPLWLIKQNEDKGIQAPIKRRVVKCGEIVKDE
jgi:hypothetical protein